MIAIEHKPTKFAYLGVGQAVPATKLTNPRG